MLNVASIRGLSRSLGRPRHIFAVPHENGSQGRNRTWRPDYVLSPPGLGVAETGRYCAHLQAWVDRFALKREDSEYALVHASQWLSRYKAAQRRKRQPRTTLLFVRQLLLLLR